VNLSSFGRRWISFADIATAGAALRSYLDTIYTAAGAYTPGGTDVVVSDGGTGVSSLTAYAVMCGGTTSTGPVQSIASVGTSPQVLTSNGPGALPTFQTLAAVDYGAGNAALAYGAIGTYGFFVQTASTTQTPGGTAAGSGLVPATINSAGALQSGGSAPSGSWRRMGGSGTASAGSANVYLRIS
jgi:hypothetical protein